MKPQVTRKTFFKLNKNASTHKKQALQGIIQEWNQHICPA